MLVGDFLSNSATRSPGRVALIGRGQRLTYAEFDDRANRLANALLGLRLEKGARIAILSTNRPEYAIAYFAIARTPYISVHCSTRSTASELVHVLNKVGAEALFFESRFATAVEAVARQLDRPLPKILLDGPGRAEARSSDLTSIDELIRGHRAEAPRVSLVETDPLAITLTGGTTGLPKAVLVSHKARCATSIAAAQEFGLDGSDIVVASTPIFHTAGLFVWFGTAVMLGASIVMPDAWDPSEFLRWVERENVTAAFFVPSQLNDLITHREFSASRLKTLRNISYAGAPMGRAMYERIKLALPHVALTENYGQSEACPITIRREGDGAEKLGTVGRVASNAEIAIMDAAGNLLPPGVTGDIVTRGEQLFDGYFGDPEETAKAFGRPAGWLLTGDVGFLDEDGFLTLVDRSKDMLISGGENVYPAEIENALYQHQSVVECAVFGIPDERWGEVPAAHVVLSPEASVSEQELIDFCCTRIARFKRPRIIKFVDKLPRTAVGKIRKHELRAPYWAGRARKI